MLRRYNAVGLTSITDGAQRPAGLKIYQDLWTQKRLPVRVFVNMGAPRAESKEEFADLNSFEDYQILAVNNL